MRATSALRDDRQLVSNLERDLRRFDPGFVQPRQSRAPDGRLRRVSSWSSVLGMRVLRSPGCGAPSAFRAPATPACRSPVAAAAVLCCPLPAFSSDAASGAQKPLSQEGTSQARCSSPKEEEREPAPAAASLRVPAGADAGAALLGLPAKRGGPQGRTLAWAAAGPGLPGPRARPDPGHSRLGGGRPLLPLGLRRHALGPRRAPRIRGPPCGFLRCVLPTDPSHQAPDVRSPCPLCSETSRLRLVAAPRSAVSERGGQAQPRLCFCAGRRPSLSEAVISYVLPFCLLLGVCGQCRRPFTPSCGVLIFIFAPGGALPSWLVLTEHFLCTLQMEWILGVFILLIKN